MLVLIGTILIIIFSIIFTIIYESRVMFGEWSILSGIIAIIFSSVLVCEIITIILKPVNYRDFYIKYETMKNIETSSEDIRDARFTEMIIEINTEIKENRYWVDNKFVGLFYNRKIAELELLVK